MLQQLELEEQMTGQPERARLERDDGRRTHSRTHPVRGRLDVAALRVRVVCHRAIFALQGERRREPGSRWWAGTPGPRCSVCRRASATSWLTCSFATRYKICVPLRRVVTSRAIR